MFRKIVLYLLISIASPILGSTQALYSFSSPKDQKRFEQLINQTRCLVCKNQTIAESHTTLAKDLRQKIYELLLQGNSDKAIQAYLVNRYGDFILFEPIFKPTTYLLWLTPFAVLILALSLMFYVLYQRKKH